MQPFSLVRDNVSRVDSAEAILALVTEGLTTAEHARDWTLDAEGEAPAATGLAADLPDALVAVSHALHRRFGELRRWPRTPADPAVKRVAADGLAGVVGGLDDDRHSYGRIRAMIMVPWLPNNPNNNILRVVAGYLAGLLHHPDVDDAVLVVTNETASSLIEGPPSAATPWPKPDARAYRDLHEQVLAEFGVPGEKLLYGPPPFADEGSATWHQELNRTFRPTVVFVPNVEMTSAYIHGFARDAATVYLQTSLRNRPPYDFTRYLYLGRRREIDASHIHPERWHYHSFGYAPFGTGSNLSRADIGLGEDDLVVVTAGNRLEREVDAEIAGIVADVLRADPRRKWMMLGVQNEELIRQTLTPYLPDIGWQLIFKGYVREIGDYLALSDVYANPRRTGGAVSMALAVYGGTPVLSFDGNDACNFLVDEMIRDEADDYRGQLARLLDDPGLLRATSEAQRVRFAEGHTIEASAADLVEHFKAALEDGAPQ